MRNTLHIATTPNAPVTFTWHGAEPRDLGPAGALVRMMIAQLAGHRAAMQDEVTQDSWHLLKLGTPGRTVEIRCEAAHHATAETAIIPTTVSCDGSEQHTPCLMCGARCWLSVDLTDARGLKGDLEHAAAPRNTARGR